MTSDELELLAAWAERASDTQVVVGNPDPYGKPWDNPDYMLDFEPRDDQLHLRFQQYRARVEVSLSGITAVSEEPHAWGSMLTLGGPLHVVGSRSTRVQGLRETLAPLFPRLGQPTVEPVDEVWPNLTIISM